MKAINAIGLYILFIGSIVSIVLAITLSKTMSAEQLSLENIFTRRASDKKNQQKIMQTENMEEEDPDKHIFLNRIAFTQSPLSGIEIYNNFREEYEEKVKNTRTCKQLYNVVLENCVGMWNKKEECDDLVKELEEDCLPPDEI